MHRKLGLGSTARWLPGPPSLGLSLLLLTATGPALATAASLAYRTDAFSIRARSGEKVTLRFRLEREASVTVKAYSSDQVKVATLLDRQSRPAGEVAVSWDGKDDAGALAFRGVYTFLVEANGPWGAESYDPAMSSGGDPVRCEIGEYRYDAARREIAFRLEKPAWVRIRAGIHDGPLLATPIDWRPFPAGEARVAWDGRDESALVDLAAHPKFSLVHEAFALPEGAVVLSDGEDPSAAGPAKAAGQHTGRRLAVNRAALSRGKVNPLFLSTSLQRSSPRFTLLPLGVPKDAGPVAGSSVALKVQLDPGSRQRLLEQRFEIVTYVDFVRVAEEEQAYSPCTVEVPTNTLPEGKHVVSVSVVSLTDQAATKSVEVQVRHPTPSPVR